MGSKEEVGLNNKRILFLVENLSVPFDRRVWQEALSLKEAGYKVIVICPKGGEFDKRGKEIIEGITIYRYRLPKFGNGYLGYLVEYLWAITCSFAISIYVNFKHGVDIIHACNPPDLFFLIGRFFKLFGKKFVYDQHDLCPELFMSRFNSNGSFMVKVLKDFEKASYRSADHVIVPNRSYKDIARSRGRVENVSIVRSAPWMKYFKRGNGRGDVRNGRRYMVCYLGTMGPQDGVDYLLKAVAFISKEKKREDILFVLIGSGDMFDGLKKMSRDLGVDELVRFKGRIPDEELASFLSEADLCVDPDPFNPLNDVSTMNKILEYMAFGKPIVCFDLKENRFSAGDAALYVKCNDYEDFGERIIELLEDSRRRKEMGDLARERMFNSLGWEYSKENLLKAYDML